MDDTISRQDVIEALHTRFRDGFDGDKWWNSTHVLAAIEGLPSVEPEIIRCKDCREFRRWIDTDITFCDLTESERDALDFCSRAERR